MEINLKEKKNSNKKHVKRAKRLKRFLGVDLCACGPANVTKCEGECRQMHTTSGKVNCSELYHIDPKLVQIRIKTKRSEE